jgi:drug/metabolite transporter (DMT)-like permease
MLPVSFPGGDGNPFERLLGLRHGGSAASRAHLWPGVPLALASAVLFGAVAPLSKLLLGSINPFMLAGLTYFAAGVGLAAYRLLRGAFALTADEAPLLRTDMPWLAVAIGMGGVVAPLLLMFGLSHTTASSAALLLNMEGLPR